MSSSKQLATLKEHLNTGAPNPNPPDTNQRILDEDAYVDTLSHIITRDFYPDLYTLNKQNQNIDLKGTPGQDVTPTPIKEYKQYKLNQKNENNTSPSQSNAAFENTITPTANQLTDNSNTNKQEPDINIDMEDNHNDTHLLHYVNGEMLSNQEKQKMKHLNLKQFQNIYTSEDNYSFNEIMYKNQLQHYNKYPWIYQQQKQSDDRKKYLSILQSQNSNSDQPKAVELPKELINNSKTKAEIIQEQDEKKLSDEKELQKKVDLYHGELEFWKFKAVNKLMFFPEADREQNLALMKKLQNEYGKPECIPENSRFPKGYKVPENKKRKLTDMEKDVKGYSMVCTPQVELGDEDEIILNSDNKPVTPMFHIPKVPKKDRIVHALHKKNSEKLRRKQTNRLLRTSMLRTESVYTPYDTKQVMTPSGIHINTPLVGMGFKGNKKKYKRQSSLRSIDMLSPAARKLMVKNNKNVMGTPLSSVLRDAYSTPRVENNRKRKRRDETPRLIGNTPKMNKSKRRKVNDNGFEKPKYSIKDKRKKETHGSANITDGLL